MQCPFCAAPTSVLAIRESADGCAIRRRRLCSGCERVFTTLETATLQICRPKGVLTPFSRRSVISKVRTAAKGQFRVEDASARRSRSRKLSLGAVPPRRLPARRSAEPDVNGHAPFPLVSASGRG
ncbi:hypothetical protein [Streptomyces sp. NPDC002889]|uniref:NrdR family transcriptional regulator n=1 Tax=Streptomyces sp. NPDC002889 TaxID=3364669 RepID=UPI0036B810BC